MIAEKGIIKVTPSNEIIIFKPATDETEYEVVIDSDAETIWATDAQIAAIFNKDRSGVNRHIRSIYKEGELNEAATCAFFAQVQKEGEREVKREIMQYNLDVIIAVGYRVKSKRATEFRKWATQKLKEYLIKGYVLNNDLLKQKTDQIATLQNQLNLLHEIAFETRKNLTDGFLSIITQYSKSFELLNRYDTESLSIEGLNDDIIYVINYSDVKAAIDKLKSNLVQKGEAGELFGNEKDNSFRGILGSISQTVFGELAYPSIEEQAAQLLYSIIKGHAFSDGNKRIGSFVFVWFLKQNNIQMNKDGREKVNDNALVALALAVAQSIPEQRDIIIKLIINLIKD
jgi:death-on-curing family protein